jgi:hypothetical protein
VWQCFCAIVLGLGEISHTELQIHQQFHGVALIEKQHQLAFICGMSIFSSPSAQNKNTIAF